MPRPSRRPRARRSARRSTISPARRCCACIPVTRRLPQCGNDVAQPGGTGSLIARWRDAGGDPEALPAPVREALPAVFAASEFVLESASREPGLLAGLAASGVLGRARAPGEIEAIAAGLVAAHGDEPGFMGALRSLRRHEMVRIAWRDLAGLAPLGETLHELSALADGGIRAALDYANRALAPRYGTPRSAAGEAQ